ncbi:methyltransferase FkbM family [Desulfitobacterium hafniense DCB-2]|uniref:Methyltransferase FkbM family n=1 Tax=Desulfitobacterium hafniense (strain DSM 10664 / DCB-2) TaxID=272564 RepID=B8FTU0_DESHD|nr:FkbM family methyltransferase [Desulfitobacterium hafniense]ACL22182.1 methyltransferase FkbM family [Desulfitobacterium hafniense DCB-2]
MQLAETQQVLMSAISKKMQNQPFTLAGFLADIAHIPVFLYGAGAFGRQMFRLLAQNGIRVRGFLDRKAQPGQMLYGVPVYSPDSVDISQEERKRSLLIVSIVLTLEERMPLFQSLNKLGFSQVVDGQSIRAREVPFSAACYEANWSDSELTGKICAAAELLADGASREVYARNLRAHILRNYDDYMESTDCCQYFTEDVPLAKGFTRFVDCGAYIGDTLTQLVKKFGNVETYVGFEPDCESFGRLASTAAALRHNLSQAFLYPCAVGGANQMASIMLAEGSSALSESGETSVQVVSLDNVFVGFAPTFIKMDIEGAEVAALHGAENVIRTSRPDLAVCIYHNISDYFEIPLLLHRWNPNYFFYLRAHSSCTMETVLYVTERRKQQ